MSMTDHLDSVRQDRCNVRSCFHASGSVPSPDNVFVNSVLGDRHSNLGRQVREIQRLPAILTTLRKQAGLEFSYLPSPDYGRSTYRCTRQYLLITHRNKLIARKNEER